MLSIGHGRTHDKSPPHNLEWRERSTPKSFFNLNLLGDSGTADPTKLHVAVKDGDINTVRDILRTQKSLVHNRDKCGRTALHWTVVLGSRVCTRAILKYTSWWYLDRCDYNGCTALHYAAQAARSDEVRMLLNRGAYVNAKDNYERTPMHYAALTGNPFIIHKLYTHGASVWVRDSDGHLPLDLAETDDVMDILHRLMEPKISCFKMFYPKSRQRLGDADRYPYHEEGNTVKRYLPKDMLKEKMIADGIRNKHNLVHKELERKTLKVESPGEARAKEKALENLLVKMQQMKADDDERDRLERQREGVIIDDYSRS